ncbi:hypothetical protein GALL_422230 [mine drainage metagenome]|uniref:Uncharacterized protein n=1 Tax=mine drainage metagenome TaxID=410659 RepID=A0A1J5QJB6_9ZZZZ
MWDRAKILHLVNCRRQWDRCASHLGDAWAPASAGDDDVLGLDIALVGAHSLNAAFNNIDSEHFGVGKALQCTHLHCALAHDRATAY